VVQQPDEVWIAAAESFFSEGHEVLLSIRYLYNSPCMDYALLRSSDQLRRVVDLVPDGAELTLWRTANLPIRGRLTKALLELARERIPEAVESVCLFTESGSDADPRIEGDSWHLAKYMFGELEDRMGESVAIGPWPAESGSLCAVKGGIDGPR
jgi:hypothetical protein